MPKSKEERRLLDLLEERKETSKVVERFSATDISTIVTRKARFLPTLQSKVSTYRELQELDEKLATQYETWIEKTGKTEEELEEEEHELRPSYIDGLLRESLDIQERVLSLLREIKLKFAEAEAVREHLSFVKTGPALTVDKVTKEIHKMQEKIDNVREKIEDKKRNKKLVATDLTVGLTNLATLETRVEDGGPLADLIDTFSRQDEIEEEDTDILNDQRSFLLELIKEVQEFIETNMEDFKEKERERDRKGEDEKVRLLEDSEFKRQFPALKSTRKKGVTPWQHHDDGRVSKKGDHNYREVQLRLTAEDSIKNSDGSLAARVLGLACPGSQTTYKPTKIILLVGMTGAGKSTLLDGLVNFIHDVRYEDEVRLRLVSLTEDERKKAANQAASQTDHITVYRVHWVPGMKINYNVTLIDSPGLGDTRGIEYDRRMIKNIETVFKSNAVESLNAIGFVAKSGDVRLTAQAKYIFESILQIFGKDVEDNLISLLTFHDGGQPKVVDAFKEAKMTFKENIPFNSQAILQSKEAGPVDSKLLKHNPHLSIYQDFFTSSRKLFDSIKGMKTKSLQLTQEVLKDREQIEATIEGLSLRNKEHLNIKVRIEQERRILEQHQADANANENTQYEVDEVRMVKETLPANTYVTNCLRCNTTCHFPCAIPNDSGKRGCAAMDRSGHCSVCEARCHWEAHRNNGYRILWLATKVKKTIAQIADNYKDSLQKYDGKKTLIETLEATAEEISDKIQDNVDVITDCLTRLSENALRQAETSSLAYLQQMVRAEEQEKKAGYRDRVRQIKEELTKAELIAKNMKKKK